MDIKKANQEILELSQKYGLEVNPTDVVEKVNVSIQQRVEILKTLYREAEILIFDEPTAVLTPQEIDFLLDILKSLRDDGKTIILITHKLEEIKRVADRCAILNRGKLIDTLDVKTTSTQTMANLMVGREVSFQVDKKKASIGKTVLEVKDLEVKNDEHFPVVNKVSFSVREGEIFALAGVSGNGQVEIADAITGMRKVSGGSIYLNGQDITQMSIRKRKELGMSYIPEDRQNVGLVMDMDLQNNLILKTYYQEPFSKKGILNQEAISENGREMIEAYDIRSSQGNSTIVRSMSGGNQQKAIVGREIELDSKLFIFVQPTRGLDIGAIENIHRQILQERDKGKAVLLISLELDEIMQLADTIGVIYNGSMQTIKDAKDLSMNQIGEFMMGVSKDGK